MLRGVDAIPTPDVFRQLADQYGANISAIAAHLNVHRVTVHRWVREHPSFAQAIDDARESSLDVAEDRMMMLIAGIPVKTESGEIIGWQERPNAGLIKFKLATHGKTRGYQEEIKQEIVVTEKKRPDWLTPLEPPVSAASE